MPWRCRALWAVAVLGALLTVWRAQPLLDARWPERRHAETVEVTGTIASLPERSGDAWRFVFEPRDAAVPRLRAAWYRTAETPRGGECWRFELRVRTPHGSLNPGGFDYEGWLFRQGVGATATVRDGTRCAAAGGHAVLRARQALADRVRDAVPDAAAAALIAALTVGDRSGLMQADWDLFRQTGTTHLVAISGFNVAIVAGVAYVLCRWLWVLWPAVCLWLPAPRAALAGSAVLGWAYALLAGFEPPVQRAVLMLLMVLVAIWADRWSRPSRVLAAAWLAVLVADPFAVTSPGLWLSFGAVAAIFYASLGRLRAPGLWHALVTLQLLLAVALAPLTLHFFDGASWIAPFVNLAAVPFFAVLTPWVLAALGLHLMVPAAGDPLLQGAAFALDRFRAVLEAAAQLPELWLPASPPAAGLLLAAAGVALLFAPRGLPLRWLGALCFVPLLAGTDRAPGPDLQIAVLDVGQGLAVVVRTARHALLYDAGPAFDEGFDAGASIVGPYLLQHVGRDLDLLVLSHGDRDHSGGVDAVRALLRVRHEIGTARGPPCRDGQAWEWDGVRFAMVHPDGGAWRDNDRSCVLRIDGPFTALLAGDIEAAAEQRLLRDHAEALGAEVLIAPHHGSRTSSTPEFVAAVRPRVAVYGAGWRNHFRHPRPEVVARYAAIGARQYATGSGGAITIARDATGVIAVEEHRREAARFWNAPAGP